MTTPVEFIVSEIHNDGARIIKMIEIRGQLDETNVDDKSKLIYELLAANPAGTHYIFHLGGLEYMNSKSIGYLTDWYNRITSSNGQIKLAYGRDNILDILDAVGLTSIIEHHNTLDEAKSSIIG